MMRRSFRRSVLALAVYGGVPQSVRGQAVRLEVRPHPGDTIRLSLDQDVELSGNPRGAGARDSVLTTTSHVRVRSHAVVLQSDQGGATVDATADSVFTSSTDAHAQGPALAAARRLQGRTVRLHFAPDGSTQVRGAGRADDLARGLFAEMPATLPHEPVAVGGSWSRDLKLPVGAAGSGLMKATFRLDSLSRGGQLAYITMKGTVTGNRDYEARGLLEVDGTVTGALVLDRKRGWLSDARTSMLVKSVLTPPGAEPTSMRMRVTQWVRVLDNR